ncbi:hypothetical protein ACTJKQ_14450 [Acidovorax sp. 22279]|uniref:hypothetical protein n=1 Tax=Acidovorax sp. 22279 TaxID=3453900 RepID=UPI003F859B51
MWKIKPEHRQNLEFKTMEPVEVLYEFDNALIFTFKESDRWFFAYLSDDDVVKRTVRYLVVATDAQEIANLKFGKISVYDVLNKFYVWAVDRTFEDELLEQVCLRGLASVPDNNKPRPSAMLSAQYRKSAVSEKDEAERVQQRLGNYSSAIVGIESLRSLFLQDHLKQLSKLSHTDLKMSSSVGVVSVHDAGLIGADVVLHPFPKAVLDESFFSAGSLSLSSKRLKEMFQSKRGQTEEKLYDYSRRESIVADSATYHRPYLRRALND